MSNSENRSAGIGRRFYKDQDNKLICGICAGLSDYFGFDLFITRVLTALSLVFFSVPTLIAYFLLALLLPKKPRRLSYHSNSDDESLQQRVRAAPHATLDSVKHRFREMDARMQRLERYLTSRRYKLDREFESLKD